MIRSIHWRIGHALPDVRPLAFPIDHLLIGQHRAQPDTSSPAMGNIREPMLVTIRALGFVGEFARINQV